MSTPPENLFKRALTEHRPLIGLWMGLADPYCAEICAGAGFDWLLIDNEHAPNDLRTTLAQLQAIAAYDAAPVVRPVIGETHLIKQLLDIGVRNLLIPMVDTPEQAARMVAATRYPPRGVRGVGSALARASAWNRDTHYVHHADEGVCLLVQIESVRGLENLERIAAVEGIDGIFIGPADLAASMGHPGNVSHPDVQATIEKAFARIRAAGKPPGILVSDETAARRYLEIGGVFVAVGVDATLLARETTRLARTFKAKAEEEADQAPDQGRIY